MNSGIDSDEELKVRISEGFNSKSRLKNISKSKKIENRPKTPKNPRQKRRRIKNEQEEVMVMDKNNLKELKNSKETSLIDSMKNLNIKPTVDYYLCHNCDKRYKTRSGVKKHLQTCLTK